MDTFSGQDVDCLDVMFRQQSADRYAQAVQRNTDKKAGPNIAST
jgi:hypothetical protein